MKPKIKDNFKATMLDLIGPNLKRGDVLTLACPSRSATLTVQVLHSGQTPGPKTTIDGVCDPVFALFLDPSTSVSPALISNIRGD